MPFDQRASTPHWCGKPGDFSPLAPLEIATNPRFTGSYAAAALSHLHIGMLSEAGRYPFPWERLAQFIADLEPEDRTRLLVHAGASLQPAFDRLYRIAVGTDTWEGDIPTVSTLDAYRAAGADKALAAVPLGERPEALAAFDALDAAERARVRKRGPQAKTAAPTGERFNTDLLPYRLLLDSWLVFRPKPTVAPFCICVPALIAELLADVLGVHITPKFAALMVHRLGLHYAVTQAEMRDTRSRAPIPAKPVRDRRKSSAKGEALGGES
jgi:hypothetical protein